MNYNKILFNVVLPKLKEFGKSITLKKRTISSGDWVREYDPVSMGHVWRNTDTGEVVYEEPTATEEYTEYKVNMLQDTFKNKEIDGSFIKAGDIKLYSVPTVPIETDDLIVVNGKDYYIYHVEPIQPSGTLLLYILYARNANAKLQRY